MSDVIDPMVGRVVLGRYRIVRALAKGGMGVVYLARGEGASGFSKPVVVKRMASDLMVDRSMSRMFVREARLMSRLRDPGVVGVIDFGEEAGDYLMVIEYVHGFHLGQWHRYMKLQGRPFPPDLATHICIKTLDALHYAHTLRGDDGEPLGIVHRDVSPSNILIDVEGRVKLADFGVARSRDQTEQTDQSTIKGKMPYLAPELFRLHEPTPSSDAYSAAVVLHEILVGQNEFRAGDVAATVSRVLDHVPTPLETAREDLPKGLPEVLRKALRKEHESRYDNAAELAKALREVRPGTEEQLQHKLRTMAQEDFQSSDMAELLHAPSLADRDDAWQNPPSATIPFKAVGPHPSSSPPTMAAKTLVRAGKGPARGVSATWAVAGALILAVGLGVAGALLSPPPEDDEPNQTFVVVQSATQAGSPPGSLATDGFDAAETPLRAAGMDAGATAAANASDHHADASGQRENVPPPRQRRNRRPRSDGLTGAFNRHQAEVMACFRQHPADAPEGDSISIRFTVSTDGSVRSASVVPGSLGSTSLGRCVLTVARSARFPSQQEEVSFRIPVTVRRVTGG